MWTERHRARHAAGLQQMVCWHAVREVARWLEQADPPKSGGATPTVAIVRAIAWHLRVGGGWRAAGRDAALAHGLWLVPALAGAWAVRADDARPGSSASPCRGAQTAAAAGDHRYPDREVSAGARSAAMALRSGWSGASASPWSTPKDTGWPLP